MYLAGILGLCVLLGSVFSSASGDPATHDGADALGSARAAARLRQNSAQSDGTKPATSPAAHPPDSPPPAEAQPAKPPSAGQTPARKPAHPHPIAKKKPAPPATGQTPEKKVVRQGSTADPSTQLAPGISQEQAARQRQTTNQLLASADAALQKLSGQSLTSDQEEAVAQVRSFVQQSKAADKDGDLQLAYKLALKAHLLSDGLAKP